jgi:hypothetical protein
VVSKDPAESLDLRGNVQLAENGGFELPLSFPHKHRVYDFLNHFLRHLSKPLANKPTNTPAELDTSVLESYFREGGF